MISGWIGKKISKSALRSAPKEVAEGFLDLIKKPPKEAVKMWNGLSDEDKELFMKAGMSAARLIAKGIIASDKGGKMEF